MVGDLQGTVQGLLCGDRVRVAAAGGGRECARLAKELSAPPSQQRYVELRLQRRGGLVTSAAAATALDRLVLPHVAAVAVQAIARGFLAKAAVERRRNAPVPADAVLKAGRADPEVATAAARLERSVAALSSNAGPGAALLAAHLLFQVAALKRAAAAIAATRDPHAEAGLRATAAAAVLSIESQLAQAEMFVRC